MYCKTFSQQCNDIVLKNNALHFHHSTMAHTVLSEAQGIFCYKLQLRWYIVFANSYSLYYRLIEA